MGERRRRFGQQAAARSFRLMDRGRHAKAFEAAQQEPTGTDFGEFGGLRQCLLVSYRRSGEPMPSPINFGLADDKLYVRTDANSGKVKRLRHNPQLCSCHPACAGWTSAPRPSSRSWPTSSSPPTLDQGGFWGGERPQCHIGGAPVAGRTL